MRKVAATFDHEQSLWKQNKKFLVGIDEVGRGAWAGPLVAAAVVFPVGHSSKYKFFDSKLLTADERVELAKIIKKEALCTGVGVVEVETIVKEGLTFANQEAFRRALDNLAFQPDHYLIDAFKLKEVDSSLQTPIIKGDYFCASIAAASIVAKVFRDKLMRQLGRIYRPYKFSYNKGYGTAGHQKAILKHGLTDIHRKNYNLKILSPDLTVLSS